MLRLPLPATTQKYANTLTVGGIHAPVESIWTSPRKRAMTRIKFTKRNRYSDSLQFWAWRDMNHRLNVAKQEDEDLRDRFAERSLEVREEIEFLLGGGLSEGAEESLAAVAEGDMTDFCIMVDLAIPIEIPQVPPLFEQTRKHLENFLDREPWHSLAIDNDIVVALAMLDEVGAHLTNKPWYHYSPGLVATVASVLDRVDAEQFNRFVGEYGALSARDHLQLPEDVSAILSPLIAQAAHRLGTPVPQI